MQEDRVKLIYTRAAVRFSDCEMTLEMSASWHCQRRLRSGTVVDAERPAAQVGGPNRTDCHGGLVAANWSQVNTPHPRSYAAGEITVDLCVPKCSCIKR